MSQDTLNFSFIKISLDHFTGVRDMSQDVPDMLGDSRRLNTCTYIGCVELWAANRNGTQQNASEIESTRFSMTSQIEPT